MAKPRKKRQTFTPEFRAKVLAAARARKLTAGQVKKEFGVTPPTYYLWRKKSGLARRRGRKSGALAGVPKIENLAAHVRAEVQNKIREILPQITRTEVAAYLDRVFGRAPRSRRR